MKQISVYFLALMGISLSSWAGNGVERHVVLNFDRSINAEMSERAQARLQRLIQLRCAPATPQATKAIARLVDTQRNRVDQGIVDETYIVSVDFMDLFGQVIGTSDIRLTDYAGTNPATEWVVIESLETTRSVRCELEHSNSAYKLSVTTTMSIEGRKR